MLWALKQLLVPCKYLLIRQGDSLWQSKAVYDVLLPLMLTAICATLCLCLGVSLDFRRNPSLVKSLSDLLALLIAFYMAALSDVATIDRPGMDLPLEGGDAELSTRRKDGGARYRKKLSYRQFVSYLFGYLAFLSLFIYIGLLFADSGAAAVGKRINQIAPTILSYYTYFTGALFILIVFAFSQLLITSLLGIYFLAERIQTLSE